MLSQSCPVLWDPMGCRPSRSSVHGILQARILEWIAISFLQKSFLIQGSNPGHLHCRQILYCLSHQGGPVIWDHLPNKVVVVQSLSSIQLFVTPWTRACHAPLSMEFSRQEDWSGEPFPSPGDLPNPGIEPRSHALKVDSLSSEPPGKPWREVRGGIN